MRDPALDSELVVRGVPGQQGSFSEAMAVTIRIAAKTSQTKAELGPK